MHKYLHLLRKKELLVIQINQDSLLTLPFNRMDIPVIYIQDVKNPVAYNYATVDFNAISRTDYDQVPGLSHTVSIQNHDEADDASKHLHRILICQHEKSPKLNLLHRNAMVLHY